ncbi:hypothetical protein NC653_005030 [Populus alba x Populus x berolinensis]|uniref:Uncharacterized protein n=1 Tax=Populus alba x Populus x berolinensis TaxID=444605 RepID=A0AAD6WAK6_9ROSI|nr:hypothetical protein NC653_005030 [Populus alba x Populus x berolinensis]
MQSFISHVYGFGYNFFKRSYLEKKLEQNH